MLVIAKRGILAIFKRKIQMGASVHTIFHQASGGRDENGNLIFKDEDKGIRKISVVQTGQFALETVNRDGKVVNSWMQFPKADRVTMLDENTFQISGEDFRIREGEPKFIPLLTYKFLP